MTLTPKQLKLLRWIETFLDEHRYAPTLEEIAEAFDISKVTALQHLRSLERRGAIRRKRYQTRSIELLEVPGPKVVAGLPVAGVVETGRRVVNVTGERLDIAADLRDLSEPFLLHARGESLEIERIRDGDYLICVHREPREDDLVLAGFPNGDSVVIRKALLDEPGTSGDPEGAKKNFVKILGVVAGVYRKY
jgi:repressor LexA